MSDSGAGQGLTVVGLGAMLWNATNDALPGAPRLLQRECAEIAAILLPRLGSAAPVPEDENVRLRAALEFTKAKLEILLSSHSCVEHGTGPCGDVDGAADALRRARAVLLSRSTNAR